MKKLTKAFILLTLFVGIIAGCEPEEELTGIIIPQPFPTEYGFPVAESTLIAYTQDYSNPKNIEGIYTHAWQIWAGLTKQTSLTTSSGHKIRVFESWRTPQQIKEEKRLTETNLFPLTLPHQLGHGNQVNDNDNQLAGFVKYSPAAEKHVVQQGLFDQKVAQSLIKSGASQIIGFPTNSIMIKPVFLPVNLENGKNTIKVWQGPPKDTIRTWNQNDWPNADITIVKDTADADNKTKFAISDFINFKIDESFTTNFGQHFKPGDYAVLVGMHVMTKETTRWTWQSFWWSQYPDNPHFPSSKLHASYRSNVTLEGAASHYAMTVAYSTKIPAQPYINGKNEGESLYAYNPYLEAGFGPGVLAGDNEPGLYKGKKVQNNYGIQTNCMSCHIQARWPLNQSDVSSHYNGDRYVDFQQSYGKDTLQLDFLWSVNAALGDITKK